MIYPQRMTATVEEDFVLFLIGMRINKLWKVHKWLPVARSMLNMIDELYEHPELGFLSHEQWIGRTTVMMQYWKSFEHLENFAKNRTSVHLPVWTRFNKQIGTSGDVGIWHETYLSGKGRYECVYNNMPQFGLAKVGNHIEARGKYLSARSRMNA